MLSLASRIQCNCSDNDTFIYSDTLIPDDGHAVSRGVSRILWLCARYRMAISKEWKEREREVCTEHQVLDGSLGCVR